MASVHWIRSIDDHNTLSITETVCRRTIRPFGKTPGSPGKVRLPGGLAGANHRFRVLRQLAEKLGIERLNFQILRRTMATQAQRMGSVKDIQAHLRHPRPDTTAFEYRQELPESVQEMVGSMYEKLRKGGDTQKGVAGLPPNAAPPNEQAVSC